MVRLVCFYCLHLVSPSPKAAVGAEGYEMTMLWVHTEVQACIVVFQECADERLKSRSHCFFQSLVFGLSLTQCLTVSLCLVLITLLDAPSCSDSVCYSPSFVFLCFCPSA